MIYQYQPDPLLQPGFHIILLQLNKWACLHSEAIHPEISDCFALICCSGDYPEKLHVPYD